MLKTLDMDTADDFLKICRNDIKKRNCQFVDYRHLKINGKSISAKQALLNIGIMKIEEIWKYILELEKQDCIKIERDKDYSRDMNSEVFIFEKTINKKRVYIKLTMNDRGTICISFHESY